MIAPTSLLRELVDSQISVYPSVTGPTQHITFNSLVSFAGSLGWIWLLLISFTGWGRLTAKLLRVRALPASIACITGIAVMIFIGGWLNIMGAIYAGVIFVMGAAGLLAYYALRNDRAEEYRWKPFWMGTHLSSRILLILAFLILLFRLAGTVRFAQFDVSDDSAAYLALPQKMLETHHFAADPFSERRITSSLGGSYFMQDLVLSANSLAHVGMADRTLGLVLLAAVVFDIGIAFELSAFQIALLEFLVYLVPQETYNLTFIVLPIPLLLGIIWLISRVVDEQSTRASGLAFLAGMIGGATISLKSTYLPVVILLSLIPGFLLVVRRKITLALKNFFATWSGILIVLALWMIAMKWTSGTYLFPVLGKGFDYSRYGLFHTPSMFPTTRSVVKIFLQGFVLLTLAAIQILSKPRTKQANLSVCVLAASAVSIIALNYKSSADSIWRYNFPQFFMAVIVFYASTSALAFKFPLSKFLRVVSYIGVLSMIGMICYYDAEGRNPALFHEVTLAAKNRNPILASLGGRQLTSAKLEVEYRKAEAAIPQSGVILENVAYSFLLNYKDRNILIMDWPGASAPLPGWPFGRESSYIAQYLVRNHVHYVLFDYRYALQNDAKLCKVLDGPYRYSEWVREQMWLNILTDGQLNQLKSRYQTNYDDGSIVVIDLDQPNAVASSEKENWAINSNVDAVCSEIAVRYFVNHSKQPEKLLDSSIASSI